ncbi:hypothetical protein HZY97_09375 [Sphingomonas sp. R-74633]|uniref:hypothetical protein n=1 Tax=Sphingomonas sp. R-74633 TaxID=2751188 RepID=UPI0015D1F51E|nr:hypothetical protein [Sphingomonas sp. R-74633]NYT40964.1 hypothetical protein [Sphingomonas sp. R-74633]
MARDQLTQAMPSRIPMRVLKLLRYLLCLGILFGLAGNGVAMAAPCLFMAKSEPAAMAAMPGCEMGADCPDCGSKSDSDKSGKGMKPGCMLMAGCTVVMALKEPAAASALSREPPVSDYWPVAANLTGREVVPEPEPPTLLG